MKLLYRIMLASIGVLSIYAQQQSQELSARRKLQDCKTMVDAAVAYINTVSLPVACKSIIEDPRWRKGEMGVFIFDDTGVCYVFGQDRRYAWHDFQKKTTLAQSDFISNMLNVSKNGGGIVSFTWNNGYMQAYVKHVVKDGRLFLVGSGFYPDSGRYVVEQLINSALEYTAQNSITELFERINNPVGLFVHGDIYIQVYDIRGFCVAHGKSLELIGQNLINDMSSDGNYIVRDYIKIAQSEDGYGWYEYRSRLGGIVKSTYVQGLRTAEGREYILVCGYYPTITENDVRTVVKRAVSYMRTHGAEQSFPVFSQPVGPFAYGGLTLFVYDLEGKIVADMSNPAFVGQNLMNSVDADGRFVTKVIIEQAKKYTSGWVSFNLKNSYNMMYIQKVKLPDGEYVLGAAFYPIGKPVTVRFMVEKAVRFVEQAGPEIAFDLFSGGSSEFLRGDVQVEVLSPEGFVLVSGVDRHKIWTLDKTEVDEKGVPIVEKIESIASSGGGWIEHIRNGARRRVYAKQVIIDMKPSVKIAEITGMLDDHKPIQKKFIVTSSYFI